MAVYVDSDSHLMEPEVVWREYTPAKYRELVPQVVERDGIAYMMVEGRVFDELPIAAAGVPNGLSDLEKTVHTKWSEIPRGAMEPQARISVLDEEGLDASVLYPTIGLLYAGIRRPEVAAVTCDAYNRWVADFCRTAPRRLFGVATVPLQDVDAAVSELGRAAKLGLCAATIRPTPYNHRRLCDPAYDKFWAAAQDLGMPISVHGSFAIDTVESVCSDRYPNKDLFFSHMICHPLEQEMASMDILAGGVLERFPRLKVSFLEAGAGWMLYWLDRLDGHYEKLGRLVPWLKHKPSELFRRNCFVAYDPDETTLEYVVAAGLGDNILWGADYPHFDCLFPGALRELHEKLEGLPSEVGDRLLHSNPARFYNVDFGA
ncbi:MAG TPA: amidohydrolase family protein [Candidatus Binataceae bacterium]|jgi:predicted TIM-barrel fold metal-dependent hydrolase|nr:amidohydrolase family protein [Candidatus Binataceae bacterium]